MCVNNLLKVALGSAAAGIRTRDLLIVSPALTTRPPSHTVVAVVVDLCLLHVFNGLIPGQSGFLGNPIPAWENHSGHCCSKRYRRWQCGKLEMCNVVQIICAQLQSDHHHQNNSCSTCPMPLLSPKTNSDNASSHLKQRCQLSNQMAIYD